MAKGKQKKWDRLKALRRQSRENQQPHGKAGPHRDKKDRRARKKDTQDYLAELDDEEEEDE